MTMASQQSWQWWQQTSSFYNLLGESQLSRAYIKQAVCIAALFDCWLELLETSVEAGRTPGIECCDLVFLQDTP